MMRVFAFLLAVAALATGAVWLADRPGRVLITWPWLGREIEASVAVALVGVLGLAFLAMLIWSIVRFILGLPGTVGFAARNRRRARGFNAISRGMVAIGAGDPVAARRYAQDARKLIGGEPLALLLEAQTAQLMGDKAGAEATFKAMLDTPETRTLGLRGLFVEARRSGDAKAAHAFADEAVRLSPSLGWANDALLAHHSAIGDWSAARTAVERRAALRLSDKNEARRQRAVLLAAEALATREHEPEKAMVAALEACKLAPGLVPAAALAGRMLAARGDVRKATRLLEACWKIQPHPDVAAAYLEARAGDSALDRLARAETLMKLQPADPESALTVAEAAIVARDFPRARAALLPLLAGAATVRVCLAMADLEEAEHGATGRLREWLARATRAPRDPAWVADGTISDRWLPASPVDGRLDAFVWMVPPAAIGAGAASVLLEEPALPSSGDGSPGLLPESPAPAPVVPASAAGHAPAPAAGPGPEAAGAPAASPVIADPVIASPVDIGAAAAAPAKETPPAKDVAAVRDVDFPIAHAPDDPGPEAAAEPARRRRRFGLFG